MQHHRVPLSLLMRFTSLLVSAHQGRTIKVFLKKNVFRGVQPREYLCNSAAGEFSKIGEEESDETKNF